MKIFKIWLTGKLPHRNSLLSPTWNPRVLRPKLKPSPRGRHTIPTPWGPSLGSSRAPHGDQAAPLPRCLLLSLSPHTMRKQDLWPEENREGFWETGQASGQGTHNTQTTIRHPACTDCIFFPVNGFLVRQTVFLVSWGFFNFFFIFCCFQSIPKYSLTINLWHRGNVQFTKVVRSKTTGVCCFGNSEYVFLQ